ncbi:competence protein ComX [Leuconostoc mesenteroides subsp. mesenteroides]|uniref:sigma factor n=1 Tax=Leuconostoc mesenteroides TaxID=1245 RepID=UPI000A06683A|nr:sigma factor [Leuconostoc mesenteroides]ARN64240.1 competence protein ComX [Leuconostoc mesenteroides subsp. mesenteroides]MDV8928346.1 sigma-70 family RNA polymerase sigma factor [Leuconostoc mesenteroides]ORI88768.1 competence protein ComX [Leuconostoc mesenteroides subsp. mesenteroides]ORI91820.1 competence protein ComX [Leuconostoc mesenteroides subsp. mesenteroides]
MGTDRLIGAVIAAQRGHEFAYNVLIKHLKAAIFDVHSRKISGRMKQDDWYSEGLEILMKCVQKYDCNRPRAKFSTYFITALSNRATDLVRYHYTEKAQFNYKMLAMDDDLTTINVGTDTYNPEHIFALRESLSKINMAESVAFKEALLQIIGVLKYDIEDSEKRRFEQMQYRLKKIIQEIAIK